MRLHMWFAAVRGLASAKLDITEESITALGHLYGGIKGTPAALRLNDGHYVNKKTTVSTAERMV